MVPLAPAPRAHRLRCGSSRTSTVLRRLQFLLVLVAAAATCAAVHKQGPSVSAPGSSREGSSATSFVSATRRLLLTNSYPDKVDRGHLLDNANPIKAEGRRLLLDKDSEPISALALGSSSEAPKQQDCSGRRVFIMDLPAEFTTEQLKKEDPVLSPSGFGQVLGHLTNSSSLAQLAAVLEQAKASTGERKARAGEGEDKDSTALLLIRDAREHLRQLNASFGPSPFYWTHEFALDRIVYHRMQTYPCIVPTYEEADVIYIPQLLRNGQEQGKGREEPNQRLEAAVTAHPAWQRHQGKDMFTVTYMPMWNYNNKPFLSPVLNSLTKATIESNRWVPRAVGVPYPSGFHLQSRHQLQAWQAMVGRSRRPFLFTLYASPDVVSLPGRMLRRVLAWQCNASPGCLSVGHHRSAKGASPTQSVFLASAVVPLYMFSQFCLQPHGDTCSRKGLVDSIMAGCIPVVFEPCALETQWLKFLPPERRSQKFFVRIPLELLRQPQDLEKVKACSKQDAGEGDGESEKYAWPQEQVGEGYNCLEDPLEGRIEPALWVQQVLEGIPREEVQQMRRNAIDLIPWVQYGGSPRADGALDPPEFPDALDLVIRAAVEGAKEDTSDKSRAEVAKGASSDPAGAEGAKDDMPGQAGAKKQPSSGQAEAEGVKQATSDQAGAEGVKQATSDQAGAEGVKQATSDQAGAEGVKQATPDQAAAEVAKEATSDQAVSEVAKEATSAQAVAEVAKEDSAGQSGGSPSTPPATGLEGGSGQVPGESAGAGGSGDGPVPGGSAADGSKPAPKPRDCVGRRIFILDLPPEFNEGVLGPKPSLESRLGLWQLPPSSIDTEFIARSADTLRDKLRVAINSTWVENGLKEATEYLEKQQQIFTPSPFAWTQGYPLGKYAYHRFKHFYPCITKNHTEADAVYVPIIMSSEEVDLYKTIRERAVLYSRLEAALKAHPAWMRHQGKDFFVVFNMMMWNYGNKPFNSTVLDSLVKVTLETNRWLERGVPVPYPTDFHFSTGPQLSAWKQMVLSQQRPFLFALFASPNVFFIAGKMLRKIVLWQCDESPKCLHVTILRGNLTGNVELNGMERLSMYMFSTFCVMPHGDTCTRAGIMDAIVAGCIPVVFEKCAIDTQWKRYLPLERRDLPFFVHIPQERLKLPPRWETEGVVAQCPPPEDNSTWGSFLWPEQQVGASIDCIEELNEGLLQHRDIWIQEYLEKIPKEEVEAMRRNAAELIPYVTYGGQLSSDGDFTAPEIEDAFDQLVKGVVEEVKAAVNKGPKDQVLFGRVELFEKGVELHLEIQGHITYDGKKNDAP